MQLNQLLPIFEVVHDMSDKNIFSAIEYIYEKVNDKYIGKINESINER